MPTEKQSKNKITSLTNVLIKAERKKDIRLWKRVKSILLYLQGEKPVNIARILNVGSKSIYRWIDKYLKGSIQNLYEGKHTGRPRLLTGEQMAYLSEILDSGPLAYGLGTGIWSCPIVQHVIEEEFGITYHHDHVRKILHKLNFTVQQPKKKLAFAKPELQQKWVRETYPALKKTSKRKRNIDVSG